MNIDPILVRKIIEKMSEKLSRAESAKDPIGVILIAKVLVCAGIQATMSKATELEQKDSTEKLLWAQAELLRYQRESGNYLKLASED